MDPKIRDEYQLFETISSVVSKKDAYGKPFGEIILKLMKMGEIESPMCQLEHIYKCCTIEIQKALDLFWRNYDIPKKKLSVDVDNL